MLFARIVFTNKELKPNDKLLDPVVYSAGFDNLVLNYLYQLCWHIIICRLLDPVFVAKDELPTVLPDPVADYYLIMH